MKKKKYLTDLMEENLMERGREEQERREHEAREHFLEQLNRLERNCRIILPLCCAHWLY